MLENTQKFVIKLNNLLAQDLVIQMIIMIMIT